MPAPRRFALTWPKLPCPVHQGAQVWQAGALAASHMLRSVQGMPRRPTHCAGCGPRLMQAFNPRASTQIPWT